MKIIRGSLVSAFIVVVWFAFSPLLHAQGDPALRRPRIKPLLDRDERRPSLKKPVLLRESNDVLDRR